MFPAAHKTTMGEIKHHSGLNKQARLREKASGKAGVDKVYSDLAKNSMRKANLWMRSRLPSNSDGMLETLFTSLGTQAKRSTDV